MDLSYSPAQFEADITAMKPRLFDTYILPAFLCLYAIKDRGMKVNARRMLFIAGIYMGYMHYSSYKKLVGATLAVARIGVQNVTPA